MVEVLRSVQFGNWKGYEGSKEEIPQMFKKCKEECSKKALNDLLYNESYINKMQPNENGLYTVDYWSQW